MRLAIPTVEAVGGVWFPIFMKKAYFEEDFVKLREKIQKVEELVAANGNSTSPFAFGTENPTQLDVHIYGSISRIEMYKGSVYNDSLYEPIHFENYPHLIKLLAGFRSRPEFVGVLANPKPYHRYLEKSSEKPPGEKVQLYLPCPNDV